LAPKGEGGGGGRESDDKNLHPTHAPSLPPTFTHTPTPAPSSRHFSMEEGDMLGLGVVKITAW